MKIGETLYVKDREEWRSWLKKHHKNKKEIWLIYYKKQSKKPRIPYNDAVDEALCFGWIDSIVKGIDGNRFTQRFTPRRQGSSVSEMNKERIRRLIKNKRMTSHGINAIAKVFNLSEDKTSQLIIASDILKSLKSNKQVWTNFQNFPEYYKKIRIAYLENRRPNKEMFQRSLKYFIKMTEKNKKFGMLK